MTRNATPSDAEAVRGIYNPYVLGTTVSFEEAAVTAEEMARRIEAVAAAGLPWLVLEQGSELVGYAYATPWKARSALDRRRHPRQVEGARHPEGRGAHPERWRASPAARATWRAGRRLLMPNTSALRKARTILIVALTLLTGFLAVSAIPGGVMLLAGIYSPPVEQLRGSIFRDFSVPGLSLLFLVGGTAAVAAVLLVRRHRYAIPAAAMAGLAVMVFELVEVLAIGSPPGPARIMQIVYFSVGASLGATALGAYFLKSRLTASTSAPP